jgi:hypothetical protein
MEGMEISFYQEYVSSSHLSFPFLVSPTPTESNEVHVLMSRGYGPLTVHWGAGPVWTSPLITGVLGCVAAGAKLAEEWHRQG